MTTCYKAILTRASKLALRLLLIATSVRCSGGLKIRLLICI